ncbi:hypothetical protein E4U53_002004 [Claviceps sorghi]|nr:hypothetical protein E4U53_002004 [Claviceps sorghi]
MTRLSTTLLALVAAVAAYPVGTSLSPRDCQPGALVCDGSNRFAICNLGSRLDWMSVSQGTKCVCSGSMCTIQMGTGNEGARQKFMDPSPPPPPPPPAVPSSSSSPPPPPPPPTPAPKPTSASPPAPKHSSVRLETPSPDAPQQTGASKSLKPLENKVELDTKPQIPGKSYLQTFSGNGEPSQGWPAESKWIDFESMWSANLANTIHKSCEAFNQENNSDQESAAIKKAIETVSKSSGVDKRFILAVVMQESGGCVRVPTTNNGVTNPGLMQSHNGAHSCANTNPCPDDQILGMVQDGTTGTSSGDGLQQILASSGDGVSQYYKAARKYNSGSIAATGVLQDGIATHCYASDIANRLLGWSEGVGKCHFK